LVQLAKKRRNKCTWDGNTANRRMWWGIAGILSVQIGGFILLAQGGPGVGIRGIIQWPCIYWVALAVYRKRDLKTEGARLTMSSGDLREGRHDHADVAMTPGASSRRPRNTEDLRMSPGARVNRSQKLVLAAGILVLAVMGIYPPWMVRFHATPERAIYRPIGYASIFDPPNEDLPRIYAQLTNNSSGTLRSERFLLSRLDLFLDISRLLTQWAIVALITAGLFLLLRDGGQPSPGRE